jgi:hypothetical protein
MVRAGAYEKHWLDLVWVGENSKVEWGYHGHHFYHLHSGERPSLVEKSGKCYVCNKEMPSFIALAFKLHGGK